MKMKMKKGILMLTLVILLAGIAPITAIADATTNESIDTLTLSFEGHGNSTMIHILIGLNSVAMNDNTLIIDFWIDVKDDAHQLGACSAGADEMETIWDITKWQEGFHTLIAEMRNPSEEVTYDNKADNRLDLPFCTQDWFWAPLGEIYGFAQYQVSRASRQQANGTFSLLADYPLWMWIILIIVIITIIIAVKRARKKNRGYYRQYARNAAGRTKDFYGRF